MIYIGTFTNNATEDIMESTKFKMGLLIIAAAVIIPVLNALYGMLPAVVTAAIVIISLIILVIYTLKRPKDGEGVSGICSDIRGIALTARGKNYVISTGTGFNIDDNCQDGIMSYVDGNVWRIEDNGVQTSAPVEIRIPAGLALDEVSITAYNGNVIASISAAREVKLDIHDGTADMKAGEIHNMGAVCGEGRLDVSAGVIGSVGIGCGSGTVRAELDNEEDYFNIEAVSGMGSIKVGDEMFGGTRRFGRIDNNSEHDMKVNCGMGYVEISFRRSAKHDQG